MITSPRLYTSLLMEVYRLKSPKRVLIIGAQIPSIVIRAINALNPGDELVICEPTIGQLHPLTMQLNEIPAYAAKQSQIKLLNNIPAELNDPEGFHAIILTRPIDLVDDEHLEILMKECMRLLKPSGTLSCMELAWLRKAKEYISVCWNKNSHQNPKLSLVEQYINATRIYKDTIWTSFPPVWVHQLRFTPSTADSADSFIPSEDRESLTLGTFRIAKDFLKFLPALLGSTYVLRRLGTTLWYLPLILLTAIAAFLRDPYRRIETNPEHVLSACDGKVLEVKNVVDPNLGAGEWTRIATFLSLANVHINRAPVAGKIVEQFTVSGPSARANLPEASHNHACYTVFESPRGQVIVAQRVGAVARRISNWMHRGEVAAQGEKYGLIRMGSRTDIYLPVGAYDVKVKRGDRLKAGMSIVAVRVPQSAPSAAVVPAASASENIPAAVEQSQPQVDAGAAPAVSAKQE